MTEVELAVAATRALRPRTRVATRGDFMVAGSVAGSWLVTWFELVRQRRRWVLEEDRY